MQTSSYEQENIDRLLRRLRTRLALASFKAQNGYEDVSLPRLEDKLLPSVELASSSTTSPSRSPRHYHTRPLNPYSSPYSSHRHHFDDQHEPPTPPPIAIFASPMSPRIPQSPVSDQRATPPPRSPFLPSKSLTSPGNRLSAKEKMRYFRRSASPSARPTSHKQHRHPPTHLSKVSTPTRKDHSPNFVRVRSMDSPTFDDMTLDQHDTDAANLLVMLHNCPSPARSFAP
ncbi:hypothetical protein INT43_007417 [Umbelopsis isabellina]|uniref:Uncharacterized protein n=1 Tax=Mortierella isabellina TaxID=91625 RepID=A0A8H7PY34_MORIS|nr:hypothetical protein INT43_007417 [Umbelopsis isabellina]